MQIRNWRPENKMLLIAALLSIVGLIIFLSLIPVSKWLWAGWLFGVTSIFIGHGVSILLIKIFFKKKRSKLNGFFSGMGRTVLNYVIQVVMFFAVIAIDTSYNGVPFMNGGTAALVSGPIVIYTYLGGISVMAVASVTSLLIKKKEGADETVLGKFR